MPPWTWAYPRSRGGTIKPWQERQNDKGLSTLARGNPPSTLLAQLGRGPIPARAGEP